MDITQIYNVSESIGAQAVSEHQSYKVGSTGEYTALIKWNPSHHTFPVWTRSTGCFRKVSTYNILTSIEADNTPKISHILSVDSYSDVMFIPAEVKCQNWWCETGKPQGWLDSGSGQSSLSKPSGSRNQLLSSSPSCLSLAPLQSCLWAFPPTVSPCHPAFHGCVPAHFHPGLWQESPWNYCHGGMAHGITQGEWEPRSSSLGHSH